MKTLRSRCINPKCGDQYRHEQASRQTCSDACRQAVYRQRKAALVALVRVLAAAKAKVKVQEMIVKVQADAEQKRANRREAAFEEERERHQQAAREEAEAERRRPAVAPAQDNSRVTIYINADRYNSQVTRIPRGPGPGAGYR